jgi:hypothetical protein
MSGASRDSVRILVRPFATYRATASDTRSGWWVLLRGPLLFSLVIAAFVSWTTAGRLVGYHLLFAPISWGWVLLWQVGWLWLVTRAFRTTRPFAQVVDLYYLGHSPWMLLLLAVSGLCLLVPEPSRVLLFLWSNGIVLPLVLSFVIWGMLLTFALFRAALGLSRIRALLATVLFYLGSIGSTLGYYLASGQLAPILR